MTTCVRHTHTQISRGKQVDCGQKIQNATVDTAHVQVKCGCVEILLVDIASLHCLRRGTILINTGQKKGQKLLLQPSCN